MATTQYISFVLASVGLILVPGPNVLVIVSTSAAHGRTRGLQTVAGTATAMSIQLIIAALGTAWLIRLLADGLYILKWTGVVYLVYLGLLHIKQAYRPQRTTVTLTASNSFARGFLVSLTNPKTILFFAAFLPQFVASGDGYFQQICLLSVIFLLLATLFDSCYALLAARLQPKLDRHHLSKAQNWFSGIWFLVAGAWLATGHRAQ